MTRCEATTVFWPDVEACDVSCTLEAGHDGPHYDEIFEEWTE